MSEQETTCIVKMGQDESGNSNMEILNLSLKKYKESLLP